MRRIRGAVAIAAWLVGATGCSKIPPGRSAVDSVRILNAKELSASEVGGKLATQESTKFLFLFQGVAYDYSVYDESVLQRDMSRVERIYRSKGFMDAHARVSRVYQVKKDHVRVEIVVDEGLPTKNRNVVVVGLDALPKDVAAAAIAAAKDAVTPGKRFDEADFKKSEDAVKKALTDRGYAYASVDSQAELDIGQRTVDYGFAVTAGPRAVFGPIKFVGLDPTGPRPQELPEGPLRRAVDIQEGQVYSTAAIDAATQALLDLEVFSAVDIVPSLPNPPPADHVVPLTIKVEPMRLRQITLGGGAEIDEIKTEAHAVLGWEDHNFLGGLRDFSVNEKPGVVLYPYRINNWVGTFHPLPENWLRTELRQPGFPEARTTAFIRPQYNIFPLLVQLNPPDNAPVIGYQELKVPIGLDRTFFKKLYVSLDYTFQLESPFAYVGDFDPALHTIVLSYPEIVTHLDLRDSTVRPHEGAYFGNTLQVAGLGGNAVDFRIQPEARTYVPVAHGVTFATRASVGFLWFTNYGHNWQNELENSAATAAGPRDAQSRIELGRDTQIVYFRGFFSGGPSTNRGYPLLGVSPHGVVPFLNPATATRQVRINCDPSQMGFDAKAAQSCFLPVGGFTLWELQNEVRFDISGPLSGAVFCDMSDVSPNQGDVRLDHLHLSCGIGAAYDTPVGPIRADLGYRIPPLQVLGYKSEDAAARRDPVNGVAPTILDQPFALAIGIGQAF